RLLEPRRGGALELAERARPRPDPLSVDRVRALGLSLLAVAAGLLRPDERRRPGRDARRRRRVHRPPGPAVLCRGLAGLAARPSFGVAGPPLRLRPAGDLAPL